jgi:hypothetical protein
MRNRRLAIAGVALVAVLGLAGCGPDADDAGSKSAGPAAADEVATPADPAAELAAAATKLSGESLKVKMEMAAGLNAEGVANADGSQADMTMTMAMGGEDTKIAMRKLGDDIYVKFDGALGSMLGGKSGKWMHADASKLPEGSAFAMQGGNPKDASKLIAATTNVEKTGEGSYKGVLDMTKAPNSNKKSLEALGDKAKSVPFTAKVDSQGRLTELVMDVGSIAPGAGTMTTTYSDFGTEVSVKAPPAKDVVEMPAELAGAVGS